MAALARAARPDAPARQPCVAPTRPAATAAQRRWREQLHRRASGSTPAGGVSAGSTRVWRRSRVWRRHDGQVRLTSVAYESMVRWSGGDG